MSKLFNTLEKIRHHEASGEATSRTTTRRPTTGPKEGPNRLLSLLLVAMLAVMVGYTFLLSTKLDLKPLAIRVQHLLTTCHLLPAAEDRSALPSSPSAPPGMLPQGAATTTPTAAEQAVQLSRLGAELFRNGEYWRSIYFFDRARQLDPQAPEPLVDMAAALSELGLYGPANRLLREANALNPDDPGLRRNLAILAEAGRLDETLQAKVRGTKPISPPGR